MTQVSVTSRAIRFTVNSLAILVIKILSVNILSVIWVKLKKATGNYGTTLLNHDDSTLFEAQASTVMADAAIFSACCIALI